MSKHRAERRSARRVGVVLAALGLTFVVGGAAVVVPRDAGTEAQTVAQPGAADPTAMETATFEQEIGRASCRERVSIAV